MDDDEITDEVLSAYIDGELSADLRRSVQDYLRRHPEKLNWVKEQLALGDALRQIGQNIADEPVPPKIQRILKNAKDAARRSNGRDH